MTKRTIRQASKEPPSLFRGDHPRRTHKKCSQCIQGCKQPNALIIVVCPSFVSTKKKLLHPALGESATARALQPSVATINTSGHLNPNQSFKRQK